MNTDDEMDLHAGKSSKLLLEDETRRIIGCAFGVLNDVGHGFHEKIYENSLVVAFRKQGIPYRQQVKFPVKFLGETVGEFVPDLIAFNAVIVDAKVIDRITDHERGQLMNYLRVTRLRVGLILNFKHPRLEWDRIVL